MVLPRMKKNAARLYLRGVSWIAAITYPLNKQPPHKIPLQKTSDPNKIQHISTQPYSILSLANKPAITTTLKQTL